MIMDIELILQIIFKRENKLESLWIINFITKIKTSINGLNSMNADKEG